MDIGGLLGLEQLTWGMLIFVVIAAFAAGWIDAVVGGGGLLQLPALLLEELPENDCPPVRVKLLSERLIAFRDSSGRFGLVDEFCAHRGVSLVG